MNKTILDVWRWIRNLWKHPDSSIYSDALIQSVRAAAAEHAAFARTYPGLSGNAHDCRVKRREKVRHES